MICDVVFRVGSVLSIFSMARPKDKSPDEFLQLAKYRLIDMYTNQFVYMSKSIDSIPQNIDDMTVSIIGFFDINNKFYEAKEIFKFDFNDLDVFSDLKSKLNDKFHIGNLKRSNVKNALKGDNVVKLVSDSDVQDYAQELKGVKNEIQKD